jgi:hypothetical protein
MVYCLTYGPLPINRSSGVFYSQSHIFNILHSRDTLVSLSLHSITKVLLSLEPKRTCPSADYCACSGWSYQLGEGGGQPAASGGWWRPGIAGPGQNWRAVQQAFSVIRDPEADRLSLLGGWGVHLHLGPHNKREPLLTRRVWYQTHQGSRDGLTALFQPPRLRKSCVTDHTA